MDWNSQHALFKRIYWAAARGGLGGLAAIAARHDAESIAQACRRSNCAILRHAAYKGSLEVLQWLADHGAATPEDCCAEDPEDGNAFSDAAAAGHTDVLDWLFGRLVAGGLAPEQLAPHFGCVLFAASTFGRTNVLGWLAARGALTRETMQQSRPWLTAALNDRLESLRWFEEYYSSLGLPPKAFVADLVCGALVGMCVTGGSVNALEWTLRRCSLAGHTGPLALADLLSGDIDATLACEILRASLEGEHISTAEWLHSHGFAGRDVCLDCLHALPGMSGPGLHWLAQKLSRADFAAAGREADWLEWWDAQFARAEGLSGN